MAGRFEWSGIAVSSRAVSRNLKGVECTLLEADDLFVCQCDRRERHGYRDKQADEEAQEPDNIHQEREDQKHGEAEVIVLHDRVAGLHRGPEIHSLVHNKQVRELVDGRNHEPGNNQEQESDEREDTDQKRSNERWNEKVETS